MRRREFLTLLGSVAVTWPLAARAQQPAKVPRVGILSPAASETAGTLTAFREGIRDLGYVEGQTVALDFRLSKGVMDALPALAAELVRIPVNVIVTDGAPRWQHLTPRAPFPSSWGQRVVIPLRSGWRRASRGRAAM